MIRKILFIGLLIFNVNFSFSQDTEGEAVLVDYGYAFNEVSYCSFYEFKIFADTSLDNKFISRIKEEYINKSFFSKEDSLKGLKESFLKVNSQLSFYFKGEQIVFVNYEEIKKDRKTSKVFSSGSFPFIKGIENVLRLKNDVFWQFYNKTDNPNYPEINKLKPLVKDANGVLNIENLAKVIQENKASLAKYLD